MMDIREELSANNTFFNSWRLKWYPRVVLLSLLAGFTIAVLYGRGALTLTGRLGGDYPAFYGAGQIVSQGQVKDLYNPEVQKKIQTDLIPGTGDSAYLAFAYPPQVALAYMPLSLLDYRLSYVVHTFIMLGSLFLSLSLIRPMVKAVDSYFLIAFTLSLSFFPILRSVTGGQNTTISILIIAAAWRALEEGHEYLGGAVAGLLLFKPQLALPFIGVLALAGYRKACIGSVCTAIIFYYTGVLMQGPDWLPKWLEFAKWFSDADSLVNKKNAISWLGFFKALPVSPNWSNATGWLLTTITVTILSWFSWKVKKNSLGTSIGFTCICLVLISPHLMFYDMGLILFTVAVLLGRLKSGRLIFITGVWLMGFSQMASGLASFSPLFFLAAFLWVFSFQAFLLQASLRHEF